jgi:hypothetical protein
MSILLLKEFRRDFFADDLCADIVFLGKAQSHLFQDEFHFLSLLHGAKCFHLQFLQHSGGLCQVTLFLSDLGQSSRQAGSLNFNVNLQETDQNIIKLSNVVR